MKLSERLQYIADEINCGETMADIGTDHGFLPLYLLEKKKCPKVIMADISSGSLKKAEINCRLVKPKGDYELRLGNGIDVLEDGEVDTVVIAGMGGLLISDILDWNLKKSRSVRRYILQPRNNAGRLRHWLVSNGFSIVKEGIVREGKFLCEILTVESGDVSKTVRNEGKRPSGTAIQNRESISRNGICPDYGAEFDYPEALLTFGGPLTWEYLQRHLETEQRILEKIEANAKDSKERGSLNRQRIERLSLLMRRWEEMHGQETADRNY